MAGARGDLVNWLQRKEKPRVGNAMPTARPHSFEDADDLPVAPRYY
jgi:hypothetical protein